MEKSTLSVVVAILCMAVSGQAEFRVWTGRDGGSSVEAQFIDVSGKKVILEKMDGKRIMVPKAGLCDADLEYLASVIPPEMKIKIDKDIDSNKLDEGYAYTRKQENINLSITIEKLNSDPCTREFKAHLYIIGEAKRGPKRKVVGQKTQDFSFKNGNSTQFNGSATVEYRDYGPEYILPNNMDLGWKYEGYILVIEDDKGHQIKVDTNKSTYESNLSKIKKNQNAGDGFDL